MPLKSTTLALGVVSKFWPSMVTLVPGPPESGLKLAIWGGCSTTNCWAEVAERSLFSTTIAPVVAPGGTSITSELVAAAVTEATWPLM
ncbi:hypothetical protein D3C72_961330 [compost metagenome]